MEGRRGQTGRGEGETGGREDDETLLRPEEVARKLNVSTRHVLRLLYEGKLKGLKVGRLWRVRRNVLQKFLENLFHACGGTEAD